MLKKRITANLDTLSISESKLDKSFPIGQFQVDGLSSPYRRDRDKNGGDILLYVREYISSKLVSFKIDSSIEQLYHEIKPLKLKLNQVRKGAFYRALTTNIQT